MMYRFALQTPREAMIDITDQLGEALKKSGIKSGLCAVFCPHTTAGITINENADPDVASDLLLALNRAFPDSADFRHGEGNSAAHLKASAMGSGATLFVEDGNLILGRWQGVYFCEFDGPRRREFFVKLIRQ